MISEDLANENILDLGMRADEVRRRGPTATRVWYERVHVVRASDVRDGLTVPEPAAEVRLLDTPQSLDEALMLVRTVKNAAGPRIVTAFSAADVEHRARSGWGELRGVLTQLAGVGVTDFADLPVDRVESLSELIIAARSAGLRAARLTVSDPVGDQTLELLDRIRRALTDLGGVERVNPLPRIVPQDKPTTGYEDVRTVALARLALADGTDKVPVFIEVDWSLYGPKLAQVALMFGADFLDAVPATNDESLGPRRATVEDVERNIRAAGFEPREYRPAFGHGSGRPEQSRGA